MVRYFWHFGIILSFVLGVKAKAENEIHPDVDLYAKVHQGSSSFVVSGSVIIEHWTPKDNRFCVMVPFNNSYYGENRAFLRHFEVVQPKKTRENFFGGKTVFSFENPDDIKLEQILPEVFEIKFLGEKEKRHSFKINFESHIPRLPNGDENEWFFDGFYPHHLDSCPNEENLKSKRESLISDIRKIKANVEIPSGWEFFGVGHAEKGKMNTFSGEFSAKSYIFAMGKGFKKFSFFADDIRVSAYYKNPDFEEQILTIKRAVSSFERWFGKFPFPELIVIESSELQSSSIPGIIAFNQPKQQVFQWLQSDLLNWKHWIMVSLIGSQWYGTAISLESFDDLWLAAGIVDFVTGEVLNDFPARFNLINSYDSGFRHFSFNYEQLQDLTAALLTQYDSKSILTTEDYISYESASIQHPLLFIKQTQTLKYLESVIGKATFSEFFRKMTEHFIYKKITPLKFASFVRNERHCFSEKNAKEISLYLKNWWTKEGWPDFKVKGFEKEKLDDGRWMVNAEIESKGKLDVPVKTFVVDIDEKSYQMTTEELAKRSSNKQSNVMTYTTVLDKAPDSIEVDPTHELFDADRFDNSSNYPSFNLFPGNAKTFSDRNYSVLWLPYVFRRPGEPGSIGVQMVLLKYIQSSFFLNIETAPFDKLLAFMATQRTKLTTFDLKASITVRQKYDGSRVAELALDKSPLLKKEPKFGMGLRFRNRQTLGQPKETHYSLGLGSSLSSIKKDALFIYDLNYEFERVPKGFAKDFDYRRDYWILESNLNLYKGFDFSFRAFWGMVTYSGHIPLNVLFNPEDVKEARIRLDVGGLDRVEELGAINNNFLIPLYLPLPGDTLILNRQLKWKIFYDYGSSQRPKNYYKAGGLGIILPFGGDFIGMGSLAITKLSLLTVLYSDINGDVSRKPRILFDMAGEL